MDTLSIKAVNNRVSKIQYMSCTALVLIPRENYPPVLVYISSEEKRQGHARFLLTEFLKMYSNLVSSPASDFLCPLLNQLNIPILDVNTFRENCST